MAGGVCGGDEELGVFVDGGARVAVQLVQVEVPAQAGNQARVRGVVVRLVVKA